MSILFFDTETTGLPLFKERSHDPRQPHIVELAIVEADDEGNELRARSVLSKPDGWTIPPDMTEIHGITNERAMAEGIPEDHVVALWLVAQARATRIVAHSEHFDRRIIRIGMTRAGYVKPFIQQLERRPRACTALMSGVMVNAAPSEKQMAAGMRHAKVPKLSEVTQFLFEEELQDAHRGLADARACAGVYFELLRRGIEPKTPEEGDGE